MPGLIHHLTCAKLVLQGLDGLDWNETDFYMGNLIPDMAKNKASSHYRKTLEWCGWDVPDLELVRADCFHPDNALLMGVYCHLFLDYYYVTEYVGKKYHLEGDKVIRSDNGACYCDLEAFRSKNGIYGDYSSTNERLIKSGLAPWKEIQQLPAVLPLTGLKAFDERKEQSWKEEFNGYLSEQRGEVFRFLSYDTFVEMIQRGAETFLKEIS